MASSIRDLRIKARRLGITNARELDADELETAIADASNGSKTRKAKVTAVKKTVAKRGPGRPRKVVAEVEEIEDEEEVAPRKRGRPKGSTTAKRSPAAKTAKRNATATKTATRTTSRNSRSNGPGRPPGSGDGTRVTVSDELDWDYDFSFREGSTAQYILEQVFKSAAKYASTADIREDVYDKLEGKVNKVDELTFMNRATGRPHKAERALQMLAYRIARTILDYAINTGQHDSSMADNVMARKAETEKVTRTSTNKKAAATTKRGPGRPRKVVEDDEEDSPPRRKPGRPKGSTSKAKVTPARRKAPAAEEEAPKRRGRPPGSKNKTTTTAVRRGPGRPRGSKTTARR